MKSIIFALLLMFAAYCPAQEYSLKEIQRAAVRVRAARGSGTGTVINRADGKYWILSNDHVTTGGNSCTVEFFHEGFKSRALPGTIVAKRRSGGMLYDMSLITVDDSLLGDNPDDHPIVIPLAPRGTELSQGDYIYGTGCPQAKWLYAWQSRVVSVSNVLSFNREPIGGESGSGILSTINGNTNVVGILTWGINGQGAGVTLESIHKAFNGEVALQEGEFGTLPKDVQLLAFPQESYTHLHVKGSDGKTYHARAYASGRRVGIDMPDGVSPIEWMQCPGGQCPGNGGDDDEGGNGPFGGILRPKNPNNPPQQGGGGAWPTKPPIGSGGTTTPKPPEEVKPDPKIKELEDKIVALQAELDKLKPANTKLEEDLAKVSDELDKAREEKLSIFGQKADLEGKIKELDQVEVVNKALLDEKKTLLDKVEGLIGKLAENDLVVKGLQDKLGITEKELAGAKTNPISNISVYISDCYNGKRPIGETLLLIGGCVGLWFVGRRYATSSTVSTGIFLLRLVGRKVLHVDDETVKVVQENDDKKKIDDIEEDKVYNKVEASGTCTTPVNTPIDVTINNSVVTSSNTEQPNENVARRLLQEDRKSDYIIGWAKNKEKDGEDVEKSALFAILYVEAVEKLRKGEFGKDGYALNFQKLAAERIDSYVLTKFHLNMTVEKIQRETKYNQAMLAFLYKEAIELLRQGKFEILGNEQLADAIDLYVKTEFYKRLGVRFK